MSGELKTVRESMIDYVQDRIDATEEHIAKQRVQRDEAVESIALCTGLLVDWRNELRALEAR